MTEQERTMWEKRIDSWTQYDCCREWRFAKSGEPHTGGDAALSERFRKRFKELGGFTPKISKWLGWD